MEELCGVVTAGGLAMHTTSPEMTKRLVEAGFMGSFENSDFILTEILEEFHKYTIYATKDTFQILVAQDDIIHSVYREDPKQACDAAAEVWLKLKGIKP